jgi:predicted transposase/invertase (TIGR01784 family)
MQKPHTPSLEQEIEKEKHVDYITSAEYFGIQKGLQQGIEKGRQEGIRRWRLEGAKKMLAKGIEYSIVKEITELSDAELELI